MEDILPLIEKKADSNDVNRVIDEVHEKIGAKISENELKQVLNRQDEINEKIGHEF